jgi:2',3'-cyclic-nucleotide 2'-phosphodiesterase (5'-nucleotidase family)
MKQPSTRSIFNWLGAGVLVLFVAGLIYFTMSGRPTAEPNRAPSSLSLSDDLSSPLPAAMFSPLPAALNSPLPAKAPTATVSPTPPLPTPPGKSTAFQLTVLHTNDTWGHLFPCG